MHSCQFQRRLRLGSLFTLSLTIFVGAACLVTATGCQKSKTNGPPVVDPPELSPKKSVDEAGENPPGTMELPDDANLNQEQLPPRNSPSSSGGLEMPKDIEPAETGSTGASSTMKIRYATWQQIEQAATSSGKITVVDLWSLVCEPCLKEFPGLVRLHQELGDRVQCISVDVDFDGRKTRPPETYEQRVATFVDSVNARFPTYISRTPSDDVYAANQLASIPAVLVYDAQGKLVKVFEDAGDTAGFTYEKDVAPLVKKLAG